MQILINLYHQVDERIVEWMGKNGTNWLRVSIGIIFIWFGMLKFFPGLSPAEDLAINTIRILTLGLIPDQIIIYGLATLETLIGLGLIVHAYMRITLLLLFMQMAGTFLPILFFPGEVFTRFPYALTLEGQYIIKNLIIVSAGIVIGSTVRRK